jgi:hypothetical protein
VVPLVVGAVDSERFLDTTTQGSLTGSIAGNVQQQGGALQDHLQDSSSSTSSQGYTSGAHICNRDMQIVQECLPHGFVSHASDPHLAMCIGTGYVPHTTVASLQTQCEADGFSKADHSAGNLDTHTQFVSHDATEADCSERAETSGIAQATGTFSDGMAPVSEDVSKGVVGSGLYEAKRGKAQKQEQHHEDPHDASGLHVHLPDPNKTLLNIQMEEQGQPTNRSAQPSSTGLSPSQVDMQSELAVVSLVQTAQERGVKPLETNMDSFGTGGVQDVGGIDPARAEQERLHDPESEITLALSGSGTAKELCSHDCCYSESSRTGKSGIENPSSGSIRDVKMFENATCKEANARRELQENVLKPAHDDLILAWPPADLPVIDLSTSEASCASSGELPLPVPIQCWITSQVFLQASTTLQTRPTGGLSLHAAVAICCTCALFC